MHVRAGVILAVRLHGRYLAVRRGEKVELAQRDALAAIRLPLPHLRAAAALERRKCAPPQQVSHERPRAGRPGQQPTANRREQRRRRAAPRALQQRVRAAREAAEAGFDMLIAAAFNFDAHASEMENMGSLAVLKARMNPDLHMPDLANTGAGNLFTVFGEPDVVVHQEPDGRISIEVQGVDMYKAGEIVSANADDIAVWFLDTDYDYESFFVRHAYFPGANDPYKALRTTLKAEIDEDAWESLKCTRSRPFERPASGRVAVKVVNHLGDEVMKVLEV
jgi:hypothetical protein